MSTQTKHTPVKFFVTLDANTPSMGSRGEVTVTGKRVSLGNWVWVGKDCEQAPLGLIRRVALNLVNNPEAPYMEGDGGWDEETGRAYTIDFDDQARATLDAARKE